MGVQIIVPDKKFGKVCKIQGREADGEFWLVRTGAKESRVFSRNPMVAYAATGGSGEGEKVKTSLILDPKPYQEIPEGALDEVAPAVAPVVAPVVLAASSVEE